MTEKVTKAQLLGTYKKRKGQAINLAFPLDVVRGVPLALSVRDRG